MKQQIHRQSLYVDLSSASVTTCKPSLFRRERVLTLHRYATSLRPLRPFARVIRFKKPQAQFLIKRLREICDREGLEADLRVLTQLVEMTSGDVRSCLNTLQVSHRVTRQCSTQVSCSDSVISSSNRSPQS